LRNGNLRDRDSSESPQGWNACFLLVSPSHSTFSFSLVLFCFLIFLFFFPFKTGGVLDFCNFCHWKICTPSSPSWNELPSFEIFTDVCHGPLLLFRILRFFFSFYIKKASPWSKQTIRPCALTALWIYSPFALFVSAGTEDTGDPHSCLYGNIAIQYVYKLISLQSIPGYFVKIFNTFSMCLCTCLTIIKNVPTL